MLEPQELVLVVGQALELALAVVLALPALIACLAELEPAHTALVVQRLPVQLDTGLERPQCTGSGLELVLGRTALVAWIALALELGQCKLGQPLGALELALEP